MALDLSALSAYTVEDKSDLITKALTADRSMDFVTLRSGIKSGDKTPILDTTVPAQAGSSCGFNSSGATSLTQVTLSTTPITVAESICLQDLEAYFTQKYLPAGAKVETADIINEVIQLKIAKISQNAGRTVFQGKTTLGNSTWLKQINGFLATIDTAGTAITATPQSSISTSTVRGIVEEIIFTKIPNAAYQKQPFLLMDMSDFRILLLKLAQDNLYHVAPSASEFGGLSMTYPGTNVKVHGIQGMNSDNGICETGTLATQMQHRILATYKENLMVGTDMESDLKDFDVWYSKDDRVLKMFMRLRLGVAVPFVDHVVTYQNT